MRSLFGFSVMLSSFTLLYVCIHYFVAWWAARHFPLLPALWLRILPPLFAIATPVLLSLLRHGHGKAAIFGSYCAYIWMGVIFILFWTVLAGTLVEFGAGFLCGGEAARLWGARLVPAFGAALVALALYGGWRKPETVRIEVPVKNLPAQLDGFRIGFFSDMHMSALMPVSHLTAVCDAFKEDKPDLILFGGDFVDPGFDDLSLLRKLTGELRPPSGKYAVFGNHEYYHSFKGSQEMYDAFGLTALHNTFVQLPNGLQIAGIDDVRTMGITAETADALLAKLDPAKPSIFMTHEPFFFEEAARRGVGLTLAGHTHDGQLFPFNLIIRITYKFVYGLFGGNGSWLYVTSGSGWWGPPMRLFTKSEMVLITLRSPDKALMAK